MENRAWEGRGTSRERPGTIQYHPKTAPRRHKRRSDGATAAPRAHHEHPKAAKTSPRPHKITRDGPGASYNRPNASYNWPGVSYNWRGVSYNWTGPGYNWPMRVITGWGRLPWPQNEAKTAPRRAQDAPGAHQDEPKTSQDAPRRHQDWANTARGDQKPAKTTRNESKWRPVQSKTLPGDPESPKYT